MKYLLLPLQIWLSEYLLEKSDAELKRLRRRAQKEAKRFTDRIQKELARYNKRLNETRDLQIKKNDGRNTDR